MHLIVTCLKLLQNWRKSYPKIIGKPHKAKRFSNLRMILKNCFLTNQIHESFKIIAYSNGPKFSYGQVRANSTDPDQTAPRGAVWSGSTLFAISSAVLGWLHQFFPVPEILGFLR